MKKNILTIIVVVVFSSIGAIAQGVFVPRPPVVYIPQLDPVRMMLEQQLFRDRMNAGAPGGGAVKGKNGRAAANSRSAPVKKVKSVTAFNPAGGRILSSRLGG